MENVKSLNILNPDDDVFYGLSTIEYDSDEGDSFVDAGCDEMNLKLTLILTLSSLVIKITT
jgi:hypothetical protein